MPPLTQGIVKPDTAIHCSPSRTHAQSVLYEESVSIDVSSVDDYIKKMVKAGGKAVMPKMKVMDMGLYARVTDTENNIIGIWENIKK